MTMMKNLNQDQDQEADRGPGDVPDLEKHHVPENVLAQEKGQGLGDVRALGKDPDPEKGAADPVVGHGREESPDPGGDLEAESPDQGVGVIRWTMS